MVSGRRIYLVAPSGFPHYGDELVAAQWLRFLAEREPQAEVWLDSASPGTAQLLLGHINPQARFVDTVFRLAWAAPSEEPREVAEFVIGGTREPGAEPRWATGVELLQSADVFHVIGGSYVNSIWPRHYGLLAAGTLLAKEFGVRAVATGHGLRPADDVSTLLDELLSDYGAVDVRDSGSRAMLSAANVTQSGDDAFLGITEDLYDSRESRSVMVCAQSDFVTAGVEALTETVTRTLESWGLDGSKIGYVEALPRGDRAVFDALEARFPGIRFYPFTELWREGIPARRGQRWLTSRSHIHLMAAAAGAWGVALPGSESSAAEHAALVEAGSRWDVVAPGEQAPRHHGDAGFGRKLDAIVTAKRAVADEAYGS